MRGFHFAGVAVVCLGLAAGARSVTTGSLAPEPHALPSADAVARMRPGAALRAALHERDQQNWGAADGLFLAVSRFHPIVSDYADLFRARALLEAGQVAAALELASRSETTHAKSVLVADFYRLQAEIELSLEREAAARDALGRARAVDPEGADDAELRFAIAQSYARSGKKREAAQTFRDLWARYPQFERDLEVQRLLTQLEGELGAPVRTATHYRRRGDALLRKGYTERALAAYDVALAAKPDRAERRRAETKRAHCLFRLRRYPEARQAFAKLGDDPEARLYRARALARSGEEEKAVAELESISASTRGRTGVYAKYLAALLLDEEATQARAVAHFSSIARVRGHGDLANAAYWRLAWNAYRAGDMEGARVHLERLLKRDKDPIGRLRARYWLARAREGDGTVASQAEFRALAAEYPLSYYGWRASGRIVERDLPRHTPAPPWPREIGATIDLRRAYVLLEAGLGAETRRELSRVAPGAKNAADRVAMARLYTELEDFHRAQGLVVGGFTETLARGPVPGYEELWWTAWPRAFAEFLPADVPVEGALVLAVMREESGYRPAVVSSAGARGLLQIMPETGERLAGSLGLATFDADDLFLPHYNVRLGSSYLHQLLARFGGRPSAAIGSYNAGPEAVQRWLLERPQWDDDAWVESIPYTQTRRYVKRVLRSLHAYRALY